MLDTQPAPPAVEPDAPPRPALEHPGRAELRIAGNALGVIAAVALCFVVQLSLFGAFQHRRDQQVHYAGFREQLAQATAPIGPVDEHGRLLAAGTPVAIVEIAQLGVTEVVGEGTTSSVLVSGPGHRRDSVLPGQAGTSVIMGRRAAYGGPFARIGELGAGAEIAVTTGQGRHTFTVLGVRLAGDPQPPPLGAGQGRLTLITAAGPAFLPDEVVRVDAALTSAVQPTPPQLAAGSLPESEQAMAGESGALLGLALWAQALVAAALAVVWLRLRCGRWHAWVIGLPVLAVLGFTMVDQFAALLPNLL